jgi:hypothetical protein
MFLKENVVSRLILFIPLLINLSCTLSYNQSAFGVYSTSKKVKRFKLSNERIQEKKCTYLLFIFPTHYRTGLQHINALLKKHSQDGPLVNVITKESIEADFLPFLWSVCGSIDGYKAF